MLDQPSRFKTVAEKAKVHGKFAGIFATSAKNVIDHGKLGFTFIGLM